LLRSNRIGGLDTDHVFIQHVRSGSCNGCGLRENSAPFLINAPGGSTQFAYLDHVSARWSQDENIVFYQPSGTQTNITVARSISSEGLNLSSHSDALVISGGEDVTFAYNLLALNRRRAPKFSSSKGAISGEIINNIIYGWGGEGATALAGFAAPRFEADIIGNLYKRGNSKEVSVRLGNGMKVYVEGNVGPNWSNPNAPSDWGGVSFYKGAGSGNMSLVRTTNPTNVPIINANTLMTVLLPNVGARPADRDPVDIRVINHVLNGTGNVITHEGQVGGYPTLAQNTRALTLPTNPNAPSDLCNVGNTECYTRLEKWLYLCAQVVETGDGNCDNSELLVGMPVNFTVAFIGDQGVKPSSRAVLQLSKDEGAAMVLHQGDLDYTNNPAAWEQMINDILGPDFPYFASVGNHDDNNSSGPQGYQAKLQARLDRITGASCTGDLGVKSACTYNGLFFILSGAGPWGPAMRRTSGTN